MIAPQSILENVPEDQLPPPLDESDINDLNARKNYKIFHTWALYNDLMTVLPKLDEKSKDELRDMLIIIVDRIGRVLSVGDIGLELLN
jgi:hypothetical protein